MIAENINSGLIICALLLIVQIYMAMYFIRKKLRFPPAFHALHIVNSVALASVSGFYFYIFITGQFQFYQAWLHSSEKLPLYFKIASTWEGQEGSFLLWGLFQVVVNTWILTRKNTETSYAITVLLVIQLFLLLPLIQLPLLPKDQYLFSFTTDVLNIAPASLSTRWLLKSGEGLNPLLHNFWMTVHPPVMFFSFALASIPFAHTVTGIFRDDYSWIREGSKALKISMAALTIGILMGAYWAYETLSFGGYWSWDPVENAILLPWITGIAALHINYVAGTYHKQLGLAAILTCLYFILIVYSTFLTRSGLLQNTSVHAFVDNGHQGILTIFLITVTGLCLSAVIIQRKNLFAFSESILFRSKQDWLVVASVVLMLAALQIFTSTSTPVFNYIMSVIGVKANLAPSASTISYSTVQGIAAILLLIILLVIEVTARRRTWWTTLPFILSGSIWTILMLFFSLNILPVTLLLLCITLGVVLFKKATDDIATKKISGALLSHAGFILLLAGIVFSNDAFTDTTNATPHTLLKYSDVKTIHSTNYSFGGRYVKDDNGELIHAGLVRNSLRPGRVIAKDTIHLNEHTYLPGSRVNAASTDTYFKVTDERMVKDFYLHIHFENENNYFITPTIERQLLSDTYLTISNFRDHRKITWKDTLTIGVKNKIVTHPAISSFNIVQLPSLPGISLNDDQKGFMVSFFVNTGEERCLLSPIVIVGERDFKFMDDFSSNEGLAAHIQHWTNENDFTVQLFTGEKDWITVQVEEKPLINLFWSGGFMIAIGILLSSRNKKYKFFNRSDQGNKETMIKKSTHKHDKL